MKRYRSFLATALLLKIILAVSLFGKDEFVDIPQKSSQLIVVSDVNGTRAKLSCYERVGEKWRKIFEEVVVNIGRNGVGKEREGDGKTPVGVYPLKEVYGYDKVETKMPFFLSDKRLLCVDDADSRYYNQIVDSGRVVKDFNSFEYMRRDDGLYEIVVTVGYNAQNRADRGSCIFLHISNGEKATAGCIAMEKEALKKIVKWLDPKKFPLILISG